LGLNTVKIDTFLHIFSIKNHTLLHVLLLRFNFLRLSAAIKVVTHGVFHSVHDVTIIHQTVGHSGRHFSKSLAGNIIDLLVQHLLDLSLVGGDVFAQDSSDVIASHISERC
jgi:hypothetical protein